MRSNVYHRLHRLTYAVAAIVTLVVAGQHCCADTLVLNNGRQYEGRLISQDDRLVTFEISQIGVRMILRLSASEVKQVIRNYLKTLNRLYQSKAQANWMSPR